MRFYIGLHHPADSKHFGCAFISVNAVRGRKSGVPSDDFILDSGAFTEIFRHGHYRHSVRDYAREIIRLAWRNNGMHTAVSQDYMCEPFILEKTGLSVAEHQRLTISRYDQLRGLVPRSIHIMPVLQGYTVAEYLSHLRQYGHRLTKGMHVGIGSVCKRNGKPKAIEEILIALSGARPDIRWHGFGVKLTALANPIVRSLLHTADSMAWSFAARYEGRNGNDWKEAQRYLERVEALTT